MNPALRNRRLTTGLLAVAVAASVSACGASLDAQTYQERNKLTVTNAANEQDRLVEVTSSAAQEVVVLAGGREREMVVPALGSTGDFVTLELRGLTRALRPGEYVDLTFRFAGNGSTEVLAPVITTGENDRPIYTGERLEGGEEPALQAPAGGHHGEGAHGPGEGEGEEGNEPGAVDGDGEDGAESGSAG